MRCAVASCKNLFKKFAPNDVNLISFHRFPKDPTLRDIWIRACNRAYKLNPDTSHICSLHFEKHDFELNFKAEFLNINSRRRLKPLAIPTKELSNNTVKNDTEQVIFNMDSTQPRTDEVTSFVDQTERVDESDNYLLKEHEKLKNNYLKVLKINQDLIKEVDLLKKKLAKCQKDKDSLAEQLTNAQKSLNKRSSRTQLEPLFQKKRR